MFISVSRSSLIFVQLMHKSEKLVDDACGTLKCENVSICEKVARSEEISTLNMKIDAICEKITINMKNKLSH